MTYLMAAGSERLMGALPSIDFNKIMNVVFIIFEFLVIAGMLVAVWLILIRPLFVFKVRTVILSKRGGKSVIVDLDRGRFTKKDDMHLFSFLKNKKATMAQPDYKYIYSDSKGKSTLFLYKFGENDFAPIMIDSNFADNPFIPVPSETRSMLSLEALRIKKKYTRDKLVDKLLAPGLFVLAMAIIMVIFISLFKNIGSMAGAFNDGAAKMAAAIADFNVGRPPIG